MIAQNGLTQAACYDCQSPSIRHYFVLLHRKALYGNWTVSFANSCIIDGARPEANFGRN